MVSSHLFSGDLAEVGRPVAKAKKAKANKLNLPSSFHPYYYLYVYVFSIVDSINDVKVYCNMQKFFPYSQ